MSLCTSMTATPPVPPGALPLPGRVRRVARIADLASGEVTAVVVEWSTDYIAILADGDPELVPVKHRDPGTGE